jgi:hypothetical protein
VVNRWNSGALVWACLGEGKVLGRCTCECLQCKKSIGSFYKL